MRSSETYSMLAYSAHASDTLIAPCEGSDPRRAWPKRYTLPTPSLPLPATAFDH